MGAHAQTTVTMTAQTGGFVSKSYDTTTNADTTYLVAGALTGYYDVVLHWINTQLSGTSGGTVIVQGSMVGGNTFLSDWYTSKNSWTTIYTGAVGLTDTTTVSGTTRGEFKISANNWKYIRLRYISSGTQTSTLRGTLYLRKIGS